MSRLALLSLLFTMAALLLGCGNQPEELPGPIMQPPPITIEVVDTPVAGKPTQILVRHVPLLVVAPVRRYPRQDPRWSAGFSVHVVTDGKPSPTPLLGDYRMEGADLLFEPRFPLERGKQYQVFFDPSKFSAELARMQNLGTAEHTFALSKDPPPPRTELTLVYPTAYVLPENQLKFYLHFSSPMARGEAYQHIHLLRDDASEVELPFLEIGQELWDPSGRRLTILFDPGRIKRGLKPREEEGPVLEEGKIYTLLIDADWPDAAGQPLLAEHRKEFMAEGPDDAQPDPKQWQIDAPTAGTNEPLVVSFHEPLDAAMLRRVLAVRRGAEDFLEGEIVLAREESQWRFTPAQPWQQGKHALVADTTLEDLAGNSIGRPFEVDTVHPTDDKIASETEIAFEPSVPDQSDGDADHGQ